jgi:hypothetical protein
MSRLCLNEISKKQKQKSSNSKERTKIMSEQLEHNIIDLPPMSPDTPLYNEVVAPYTPESERLLPATTETHDDETHDEPPMTTEEVLHGMAYRQAVEKALADPDSLSGIKAVVGDVPDHDAAHLLGVGAGNAAVQAHRAEMARVHEEATNAANRKLDRAERERDFSEHYDAHDINGAFAVLDEARARARVEGWDEFDALQGKLHPSESEAYLRYVDAREPLNHLTDEQILALGRDDIQGFGEREETDYFKRLQIIKGAEHMNRDRSQDGTGRPPEIDNVIVKAKSSDEPAAVAPEPVPAEPKPTNGDPEVDSPFMDLFGQQPSAPESEPKARSNEASPEPLEGGESHDDQGQIPDFLSPHLGEGESYEPVRSRSADDTDDLSSRLPIWPSREEAPGAEHDNGQPRAVEQFPRDDEMDEAAHGVLEAAKVRGQGGEIDTPTGFGAAWRGIRGRAGQRPRLFRKDLLPKINLFGQPKSSGAEHIRQMDEQDAAEAAERQRRYERLQQMAGRTATGQEVVPPVPPNQQRGVGPQARPVEPARPVAFAPRAGDPLDELLRQ